MKMRQIVVNSIRPVPRSALNKDIPDYLEYVGAYLDVAGKRETDIACLPECFADQGKFAEAAEEVPGPISTFVMNKANQHGMYVIASLVEVLDGRKYVTALLVDREGRVAGRYHKTHLAPISEEKNMGLTRGDSLPVFETDFGKIGMMICFDAMFPEVAAVMARKGAEIIFFPDRMTRPDRYAYPLYMRARAIDNAVYIVTATHGIRRGEVGNGGFSESPN